MNTAVGDLGVAHPAARTGAGCASAGLARLIRATRQADRRRNPLHHHAPPSFWWLAQASFTGAARLPVTAERRLAGVDAVLMLLRTMGHVDRRVSITLISPACSRRAVSSTCWLQARSGVAPSL